tara:strand:- start:48 stop:245 length:198 start_codon:yes stop_codon:yes gene_type:complete
MEGKLKEYTVEIWGRKRDAIGKRYKIRTTVRAETADGILPELYRSDEYEFVGIPLIIKVHEELTG